MKQLLITTHLYTFAVICVIATTISSCTFKKKTDMETPTGTKETKKQSVDKAMHVLRTLPESKRALAIAYMAGMEMRGILDKEEKGA